jgi:hypothetical protein
MENEITIKDYLRKRGIEFKEVNNELITACLFSDCDKDSGSSERHLYFNVETSQYQCKKCGATGNLAVLMKYFGDSPIYAPQKIAPAVGKITTKKLNPEIIYTCHNNLPDRIKEYLNARGITDEIIEKQKLGWGEFYRQNWITIPIFNASGKCTFLKLRKDPDSQANGPKYMVFPAGGQAEIYGRENLTETNSELVICEGEFDCLILSKFGIPAITSTAGAATFKKKWLNELEGFTKIYVALDKDEAGEKGANNLIELLNKGLPGTNIHKITLPDRMTDGKDITDYFTRYNGTPDEFMRQISKLVPKINTVENIHAEIKKERFVKLAPKIPVSIEEWKKTIQENFPELLTAAEVGLSVIGQLLISDIKNPCALIYVDMPSSGKTIALNFFSTVKELVYTTDNFTPAAFVSQAANQKKEALEKIDLLPKLQYRTMIIRDMAPIFAKKDEDVQAMLGILIRVLDGEGLENDSGVHGKRGYIGDYIFMILAASTPIRPRIWEIMGNLGSRLFFFNINGKEKSEDELVDQLKNTCRDKEIICREITEEIIKTLWNRYPDGISWNRHGDDDYLLKVIPRLAKILARLRTSINTYKSSEDKKYDQTERIKEMPDRLNQLLYNLARGHALVCGRENIDWDDLRVALRVTIDSAPSNRARMFKGLLNHDGQLATNEVMKILKSSRPTALKYMREMNALGIVKAQGDLEDEVDHLGGRPEQKIILHDKYSWFISNECKRIS